MQNRTSYFGFLQKLFFYGCFHNVAGIRSSLKKGIKKQFAPTENTSIKTNCSLISTNYIFLNLDDFTKISSLSGIKAREKINFNSICTPPGNSEVPQSLYLRAFSHFRPLFELHFYICTFINNMYYEFAFCPFYVILYA